MSFRFWLGRYSDECYLSSVELIASHGEIQIWYDPRPSELCVVTFSHMDFAQTGAVYWGRQTLERIGVSAVGVVCMANSWFPQRDIAAALKQSRQTWRHHEQIVAYGSSMGGFGALRYGRAFGARAAIGLAPQVSIKPRHCHPSDHRYDAYNNPADVLGRSVRWWHLPQHAFAIFDPHEPLDTFQANMLRRRAANSHLVAAPYMGHEIANLLSAGSLRAILDAATAGDVATFRCLIQDCRRASYRRALGVAAHLRDRRPSLANAIAHSQWIDLNPYWRGWWLSRGGSAPPETNT